MARQLYHTGLTVNNGSWRLSFRSNGPVFENQSPQQKDQWIRLFLVKFEVVLSEERLSHSCHFR